MFIGHGIESASLFAAISFLAVDQERRRHRLLFFLFFSSVREKTLKSEQQQKKIMADVIQSISHKKRRKTEKSFNLMEMALSIGTRHAFNIILV